MGCVGLLPSARVCILFDFDSAGGFQVGQGQGKQFMRWGHIQGWQVGVRQVHGQGPVVLTLRFLTLPHPGEDILNQDSGPPAVDARGQGSGSYAPFLSDLCLPPGCNGPVPPGLAASHILGGCGPFL